MCAKRLLAENCGRRRAGVHRAAHLLAQRRGFEPGGPGDQAVHLAQFDGAPVDDDAFGADLRGAVLVWVADYDHGLARGQVGFRQAGGLQAADRGEDHLLGAPVVLDAHVGVRVAVVDGLQRYFQAQKLIGVVETPAMVGLGKMAPASSRPSVVVSSSFFSMAITRWAD